MNISNFNYILLSVDIFPVIYSNEKAQVRDPQVHTAQVIKSYSSHTHVQYLRYKQVGRVYIFIFIYFFCLSYFYSSTSYRYGLLL